MSTAAIETFAKLGDSIYFEDVRSGTNPTLYIIQFISSFLEWKSANTELHQIVHPVSSWHPKLRVEILFPKEVPIIIYMYKIINDSTTSI